MEFARQVIAGPDRVPVHADRSRAAGSADASAPEAAPQRVMPQLPGADPAHPRKTQFPAGGKPAGAVLPGHVPAPYPAHRSEVGIDAVETSVEVGELGYHPGYFGYRGGGGA